MRPGAPLRERSTPSNRCKGLGHDQLADDVDCQLMFEGRRSEIEQRSGHGDAGIVDKPGQGFAAERRFNLPRAGGDCRLVCHIEEERREVRAELLDRRSPSACFLTLPKTRAPLAIRTLTQPQPMPVDAPVTTTVFDRGGSLRTFCSRAKQRAGPMVVQQGRAIQCRRRDAGPRGDQLFLVMTASRYSLGRTSVPSLATLNLSSRAQEVVLERLARRRGRAPRTPSAPGRSRSRKMSSQWAGDL